MCASTLGRVEVYPRVCGGTAAGVPSAALQRGLSPRVRGNRLGGQSEGVDLKLTLRSLCK